MANPLKELPLKLQTFQTIQEVLIAAPPEKVWKAVTNPSTWFGFDADKSNWPKSTLELQPNGRWFMENKDGGFQFLGNVVHVEPGKLLRIHGPIAQTHVPVMHATIFELQPQKDGKSTLLRFGQRTMGYLSEDIQKGMNEGWNKLFGQLKAAAESA
jgi:uncharacterized protein YndB with AHSA1/START domain